MKIAAALMFLLGFAQIFCESSNINSAAETPKTSATANSTKENNMKENNTNNDVQQISQLTLDLPKLQQYYHSDKPGRKPLNIVKNEVLKDDVSLTKFGEPVKFISADEAAEKKIPAIEFTSIKINDKTATVEFRYAVEGIRGKAEFKFTDKWEVVSSSIVET
ncbi:MAG TPA: hypothetical protein VK892_18510 [Pyrinomonadaceae bacterium]|nr:hypothetical protein [Pyrinomonadaceae bacterium]